MASTYQPGPPPRPDGEFSHTGERFVLGYLPDAYAIWDRMAPGPPIKRYPRTPEGWADAWREYSAWEPRNAPVGGLPRPIGGGVPATNGKATAALVCGIIGLFFAPVGIAAVILGFMAHGEINRTGGHQGGRGNATWGIVLGFVAIALWILWMTYFFSNFEEFMNRIPNAFVG